MKVPISKKTHPMEWESIIDLLKMIRKDVGLDNDTTSTTICEEDDQCIGNKKEEGVEHQQQPNSVP